MKSLAIIALLVAVAVATACSSQQAPVITPGTSFQSAQQAAEAFVVAVNSQDDAALREIFGSAAEELMHSGDDVADRIAREKFSQLLAAHYQLEQQGTSYVLLVGEKEWPFPVPLVESTSGWVFDTEQGLDELLTRRIGKNELSVLTVCDGYVEAQFDYAKKDRNGDGIRQYATKFISSTGKKDGLYWEQDRSEQSPIGPFLAKAAREGYAPSADGQARPYHGYYYRILREQGPDAPGGSLRYETANSRMTEGFALIAYPARWEVSGVMTFLVSHDDIVYEKNLGVNTAKIANKIDSFNPGPGWTRVKRKNLGE